MFRKDILDTFYFNIPPCIHLKQTKIFEEYLFLLIDEHNHPSAFSQLRQEWLFLRLFDQYLTEVGYILNIQGHTISEKLAGKIKLYLDNNLSEHVSINDIARFIHVDKSYLISVFKKCYHETPIAYHQRIRIQRAKNMLINTNLSITEIAESSGFSSIHDFDRVFRKIAGGKPSDYRVR